MHPLETYLRDLQRIYSTGAAVAETSYYAPLAELLNTVGGQLRPIVRCVLQLKNRGAGMPDGGLFRAEQFQKRDLGAPLAGQLPAQGALEVKGPGDDVVKVAMSPQVQGYLTTYGQVLVTNYRDFLLVGRDAAGQPRMLERYTLAVSASDLWAASPSDLAARHGEQLVEYLKRVMLSNAPLSSPRDVAFFLASYARDARARVERAKLPALDAVRRALEESLGLTFEGERGDHFFRSTLVQTLFYGIFSAWVLWSREHPNPNDRFDWRVAAYYLRVPMIEALFSQLAMPNKLRPLGLMEVLDWTKDTLNRVDRPAFFAQFELGLAVQYFYEPFLEAFDPELRKQLGVWYTPPEIVQYQVARVDAVLKQELGLSAGLADPRVHVLDPCCGTGAYLVAVLRYIEQTLRAQGEDALLGEELKRIARERVFGFELLPAPFVVAHLQLGLLLQQLGAPLADEGERVGVYLTNALTGWSPPDPEKERVVQLRLEGMPELQAERDLAQHIKCEVPILVILGNPPYSGFAGIARVEEERDLSTAYRTTKHAPAPQGQGLNDLYVRFFRMAERRIVEQSGQGVVCFISNYSWLDGLSFTGMRERYLEVFDQLWVDNLHGNRIISEYAPDGRTSETIFAMQGTSPGIKIGTAISLLVKRPGETDGCQIYYRDVEHARAAERRVALLESLSTTSIHEHYISLVPRTELGLPLKPRQIGSNYLKWPTLPEIFPVAFPGIQSGRDDALVDIDRNRLEVRMRQYFDPNVNHTDMKRLVPSLMESTARFNAEVTRDHLLKKGFQVQQIVRYYYRPLDMRWLYWEPETKLLDEKRAEYVYHLSSDNLWITAVQQNRKEFDPPVVSATASSRHLIERGANLFPLYLRATTTQQASFADSEHDPRLLANGLRLNLSDRAITHLESIAARDNAPDLFYHAIATLHAPAYRNENAGALRQDWPRIPLPSSADMLRASAELGRQVAALLDSEQAVEGVTVGDIRRELRRIAVLTREGGGSLNVAAGELEVRAGWGHAGRGGITMPGQGRLTARPATSEEEAALGEAGMALLSSTSTDIYLNHAVYWRNLPQPVWEYTLGGYQVIKKWLSYRERALLGRGLTLDEARFVTQMARRIAALLLLGPALDANYRVVGGK